jgi:hypothetical protein
MLLLLWLLLCSLQKDLLTKNCQFKFAQQLLVGNYIDGNNLRICD